MYSSSYSTPRTPSPHSTDMHFSHFKPCFDPEPTRNLFADHHPDDNAVIMPAEHEYWPQLQNSNSSRGSLLQELYDHDIQEQQQQQQISPEFPPQESQFTNADEWNHVQQHPRHDFHMQRRATFPSVRHDRGDGMPIQQYPPFIQQHHSQHLHHDTHSSLLHPYNSRQEMYSDRHSMSAETNILSGEPFLSSSPHSSYREFDESNVKLEDGAPLLVPSQSFYNRPPSSSCHPMTMSYISSHTGLPVQHTDDAASKETQYLRRRCFNCHTTEPPSWRRSTLNPGKIVCNKCGLYERTHLRPRPLRFDELRAGNKARKQGKRTLSPKARAAAAAANGGSPTIGGGPTVKKEPREFGLVRRSSVSSTSSSHSSSGASDWDENVSVYSAGSAPPTSFNSPNITSFPLSREISSSPPQGGIRLPNAPLSDIASMHGLAPQQQGSTPQTPNLPPPSPRRSHTSPGAYFSPPSSASTMTDMQQQQQQDYFRRNSIELQQQQGSPLPQLLAIPLPTPVAS